MEFIILSNIFIMFAWCQQELHNKFNGLSKNFLFALDMYCIFNLIFSFVILYKGFIFFKLSYLLYLPLGLIITSIIFSIIEKKLFEQDPFHLKSATIGFIAIPILALSIINI